MKIQISLSEVVDFLAANNLLPKQISDIQVNDKRIEFKYKTGMPFPPYLEINLEFIKYEKSESAVYLSFNSNWLFKKVLKMLPIMKNEFIIFRDSIVSIRIMKILQQHLKGFTIDDISFNNHFFEIILYSIV